MMAEKTADAEIFKLRLERSAPDLWPMLDALYGEHPDYEDFKARLVAELKSAWQSRPDALKHLDLKRDLEPDWFQRPDMVGYCCYIDRFAGDLKGVQSKLDYLESLGVNYLHLMPCLEPRPGQNDGGYSVKNYRRIDPRFGSMEDLEQLAGQMRSRGMSLCIDMVLNHTAKEHEWARKAALGEGSFQDYYLMFDDDALPKAYEESLVEIFPDDAPGSFTYYPDFEKWVWTTFNEHQWDLNWANPGVFLEILSIMLFLANRGVDVIRLDAVAFMWKRMGTRCQSEPEVHMILQALRAATRIAAPAMIHLEEAIVGPSEMLTYLGQGQHTGREGNLAYHNNLMVLFWNTLATRQTQLINHVLSRHFPPNVANATYATYLRCHDDIGWAVTDEDAASLGFSGPLHRAYLADFYEGSFEGSFARGQFFQVNEETGDKRNSGSLASLAGLEKALEEGLVEAVDLAIHRILLGNALIASFGGIPLIFMGDEIGLLNDYSYRDHLELAHDSRWLHRPMMDWDIVRGTAQGHGPAAAILAGTKHILKRRKSVPELHGAIPTYILEHPNPAVFAFKRAAPTGSLVCLFNFSDRPAEIDMTWLREAGVQDFHDLLSNAPVLLHDGALHLPAYGRAWLV